jgi:hypothetical protein
MTPSDCPTVGIVTCHAIWQMAVHRLQKAGLWPRHTAPTWYKPLGAICHGMQQVTVTTALCMLYAYMKPFHVLAANDLKAW